MPVDNITLGTALVIFGVVFLVFIVGYPISLYLDNRESAKEYERKKNQIK